MKEFVLKKRSIWFHIIVTYFTCGIWAIIYLYFKYKNSGKETKKNTTDIKKFNTNIAGVTFDNRQELLKKCTVNQKVFIKWDKDNPYSKNGHALSVFTTISNKNELLGHIPESQTDKLFNKYEKQFTNDCSFTINGYILKITGGTQDKPTLGCVIEIEI